MKLALLFSAVALHMAAMTTTSAQVPVQAPNLTATQAWVRPTVEGQQAGGGFVTLTNKAAQDDRTKDDKLLRASSPVAAGVELHSMSMEGTTMRMREVNEIAVKAGQVVALKPGGLHIMFMGLIAPLKLGDKVPVTLEFERAGKVKVEFVVSLRSPSVDSAAAGASDAKKQ
jgi:periplasmic copper chaperone A